MTKPPNSSGSTESTKRITRSMTRKAQADLDHVLPQKPFTIFSLPLEIRIMIYEFALIHRTPQNPRLVDGSETPVELLAKRTWERAGIEFRDHDTVGSRQTGFTIIFPRPDKLELTPSLLRTSKQIHAETTPVLYGENLFCGWNFDTFRCWLEHISEEKVKHLRDIRVYYCVVREKRRDSSASEDFHDENLQSNLAIQLLGILSAQCKVLRCFTVHFVEPFSRSMGWDKTYLNALGQLTVAKQVQIRGCFLEEWPAYLKEKLGCQFGTRRIVVSRS